MLRLAFFNFNGALVVLTTSLLSMAMLWHFPKGILLYAAIGVLALVVLFVYMAIYKYSDNYLQMMLEQSRNRDRLEVELLKESLSELNQEKGLGQLELIQHKYLDLAEVLKQRFSEDEITYARYMEAAKDLYKGGFRNLREIVVSLKSVKSADINRLKQQINQLLVDADKNAAEISTINERIAIHEQQHQRVNELYTLNEETLTLMAKLSSEWANVSVGADADMDSSDVIFDQVSLLIERIKKYR
jgi:hypothetical protein